MLKKGSRGDDVKLLQKKLNALGYDLDIDGIFGGGTDEAVRTLQKTWGYDVDGIVGPGTEHCIQKRMDEGWNAKLPGALEKAAMAVAAAKKK